MFTCSITNYHVLHCMTQQAFTIYTIVFESIIGDKRLQVDLTKFDNDKNKIHKDGDTLEDFYRQAHLDETRRKFLDGLKEGRENSLVEEKSPVTKMEMNWDIELVKKNMKLVHVHH